MGQNKRNNAAGQQPAQKSRNAGLGQFRGVHGWLKFFVVVNMYVMPWGCVLLVIAMISTLLNMDGPMTVYQARSLGSTVVAVFLAPRWFYLAKGLRDIKPGIVPRVKRWLLISFALQAAANLIPPLLRPDVSMLWGEAVRDIALGSITIAIWYRYFTISKRVRATYPDYDGGPTTA